MSSVLTYSDDKWMIFCKLENIDSKMSRSDYVNKKIQAHLDTEYHSALEQFLTGFWKCVDKTKLKYISPEKFDLYICGQSKYKLKGMETDSLQKNLHVYNDPDQTFRTEFLNILDKFQDENPSVVKDFVKYWFGSPHIFNFNSTTQTIHFSMPLPSTVKKSDLNDVCKVATCSRELYFPCVSDKKTNLNEYMKNVILNTIANQKTADECQMIMQMS